MKAQTKKPFSIYTKAVICLSCFVAFFSIFAIPMGLGNALNTLMNTAYTLLTGTVFYIMAIAVIAGAISALLTEFGVVALLNKLLSPLMGPLFGMPGASALGMVSTYLSDNPAILTLADDKQFRRFFKAYQIPALTNLGTAFGMGLIVTSFTLGMASMMKGPVWLAAICGNLGAIFGAIVSTRIMLHFMKKAYGVSKPALEETEITDTGETQIFQHKGLLHVLDTLMEGGKKGVTMGLAIIPGVLIICSIVMMLTNGRPAAQYKFVRIERVSAEGDLLSSTDLIEIPDKGNYILRIQPGSSNAYWQKSDSSEDDPTYSYANGRVFAEDEELMIKLPPAGFGDADSNYRLVLYKADESTKTEIPLTRVEGEDRVFSGTVPEESYRGNAGEGVAILPWIANLLGFLLKPLFGFASAEAIAVPVTALGSAGAALGMIPSFVRGGLISVNDLAVFTAICMCWSGYLSTHVSMMEVLGCREHTGKAIVSHTIGGLCAGVAAHWLFVLFTLL